MQTRSISRLTVHKKMGMLLLQSCRYYDYWLPQFVYEQRDRAWKPLRPQVFRVSLIIFTIKRATSHIKFYDTVGIMHLIQLESPINYCAHKVSRANAALEMVSLGAVFSPDPLSLCRARLTTSNMCLENTFQLRLQPGGWTRATRTPSARKPIYVVPLY
jgi:hypothetical protein